MNPDLNEFLEVWDAKWAELPLKATPADRRAHFEKVALEMRLPTPEDVDCDREEWIETPSGPVRVRIFRHSKGGTQPAFIYMHGGAWMQGSPETHWDITSRIASWNQQTVISIDYAKAPERPFPAAFEHCVAAIKWAHANAEDIGIDPNRITIGGDSAGGNLAAAAAIALRNSSVQIAAQLLIYPAADFDRSRPSYAENAEGPMIKVQGMEIINAMYSPDAWRLENDYRVAPLAAKDLTNLPPAYVAVAECDPLRDSGVAYADALKEAGNEVETDDGPGLIHGYMRAMEYCEASETSLRKMTAWLAKF